MVAKLCTDKLSENLRNHSNHELTLLSAGITLIHFLPIVYLYTPLNTSEESRVSDVFRGYRNIPLEINELIKCFPDSAIGRSSEVT